MVGDVEVPLEAALFSGAFSADRATVGGVRLAATLDASSLVSAVSALWDEVRDADGVCSLVGSFGVACEPCASDGQPYCVAVEVWDVPGAALGPPGLELDEVGGQDSDCP